MRLAAGLGFLVMIAIAWICSSDRTRFPWRVVLAGIALQFALAGLLLKTPVGGYFFSAMTAVVGAFLSYSNAGTEFVFGPLARQGFSIFVHALPVMIFSGCFFAVLYHVGVMQKLVNLLSLALSKSMRLSGAESLCAAANLFVGVAEAALVVRPYLSSMTRSELFSLMTLGMATVGGSVMLAYVSMLGSEYAGHLATASILSAPAGLLLAKVMLPETGTPLTASGGQAHVERGSANVIDAAASGALAGLTLAGQVGALLIAFVAMIALVNGVLAIGGDLIGIEGLSMERILGSLLAPLAWLMGIPWQDAAPVGALLGVKTVLNEFIAYEQLAGLKDTGAISARASIIASYALCGFANFGSLAILLGGIGGLAPERRAEVAELGLRSILAGSLATFMTACVAGMLI